MKVNCFVKLWFSMIFNCFFDYISMLLNSAPRKKLSYNLPNISFDFYKFKIIIENHESNFCLEYCSQMCLIFSVKFIIVYKFKLRINLLYMQCKETILDDIMIIIWKKADLFLSYFVQNRMRIEKWITPFLY